MRSKHLLLVVSLLPVALTVNGQSSQQLNRSGDAANAAGGRMEVCANGYPGIPFDWRPADKVLALTFDDGPFFSALRDTLEVLKTEGNVPAAFFINTLDWGTTRRFLADKRLKELLQRVLAEGHELGSHTHSHFHLSQLTRSQMVAEVEQAYDRITQVTGLPSVPLFRAPYGNGYENETSTPSSPAIQQLWQIARQHHLHIGWSFDASDWQIGGSDANCTERLFAAYGPPLVQANVTGAVLMHAAPWGMGGCPQALHKLIRYWKEAGYTFVTVSTLVEQLYGLTPEEVVERANHCINT